MAKLFFQKHLTKYWQYCQMYGVKSATRMAFRRLRKPMGTAPARATPLLPLRDARPSVTLVDRKISVIIPTKNAGDDLRLLLRRLRAQRGIRECEIVVVDSGSTDGTVNTAQAEGAVVLSIAPEQFTHAYSRNRGAEAACGDYFLFLVQDALPLTDLWLWEMATALEINELAAVSCAEYPRSDCDLFYQFLIHQQYDVTGLNQDRILQWDNSCSSYLGLRSNAQLCDIAALIRRPLFEQYRFRTAYAEDFDLGIRLIQDGHRLGFLHRTRVLHSHNRPPSYFLKRGYVDVRFLTDVFPNFVYPEIEEKDALHAEIIALHRFFGSVKDALKRQSYPLPLAALQDFFEFGEDRPAKEVEGHDDLEIQQILEALHNRRELQTPLRRAVRLMVWPHVSRHIDAFVKWLSTIYDEVDQLLALEIASAVEKIVGIHCGTHLAYLYLTLAARKQLDDSLQQLDSRLTAGV